MDEHEAIPRSVIQDACARLAQNRPIRQPLPGGGMLRIDRRLPFLCVYRRNPRRRDAGTARLVMSEASYIVAPGTAPVRRGLKELVRQMGQTVAGILGSFLLLEVWSGEDPVTDVEVDDFLLHAGQSSVLARGSRTPIRRASSDAVSPGWIIGVPNPARQGQRLAELRLRDRAVGTSGTRTQYFRHKGRRYGHILDPRTGQPAEGVLSATVVAPSGAEADALSTAFYVMGAEKALQYCLGRPELAAVLVCPADGPGGLEIRSVGLEEDELRALSPS